MFKNMKLGTRIALGFGLLIVIACLLGALAIFNMKKVERESTVLANEYVPEVKLANSVERHSLLTLYSMLGYSFSEEDKYLQEAQQELAEVKKWLDECQTLADTSEHLVKLKEAVKVCVENVNSYETLANATVTKNEVLAGNRNEREKTAVKNKQGCRTYR